MLHHTGIQTPARCSVEGNGRIPQLDALKKDITSCISDAVCDWLLQSQYEIWNCKLNSSLATLMWKRETVSALFNNFYAKLLKNIQCLNSMNVRGLIATIKKCFIASCLFCYLLHTKKSRSSWNNATLSLSVCRDSISPALGEGKFLPKHEITIFSYTPQRECCWYSKEKGLKM